MVHRELLRNSLWLLVCLAFFGCNTNTPALPAAVPGVLLNRNEVQGTMQNGLLIVGSKPFSGALFTLFPGTTDTAEFSSYLDGKEHGEWKKYYPSGKVREIRFFENGQKSGEYNVWWENGNRQMQYFFVADEYEGTCKEWSEAGRLNKVMNYKNGYEEGHQQWWYDNGKIKANYIMKDGRRYGLLGTKNCVNVSDSVFKN